MNKILKKYTTIPEHLYVKRAADKQLEEIIDDMQRPGYVLVARQMGKTNLLFHAKRTLESKNRLFVYVDLSNSFDHEKDCYRNIIDCILEPNEELFESIEIKIHNIRDMQLQPHKEYSRSLREILNYFQGDLVIVLDEIDALRGAEYSDNIFAQIRSNYFSRTNFPVFERLTYILSGVIEPTELIKDRNKSPFNIGDKIYLDDFTFEEHETFINKSKLEVDNEISREIYEWTNGNPRLTFDICAEVEAQLIDNVLVDGQKISDIINEKYLVSYDIAPVDHIRELVKSNKKIRDAVLNIHRNKYCDINDEIKNKLYLCGIIDSDFQSDTKIKNNIIANSISEEWIMSINKESRNNLTDGLIFFDEKKYTDAIEYLSDYLENSNPNKNEVEICNYHIGFSFFKLSKIDEAIEYFSRSYIENPYKDNSKSFLGMCLIKQGDIDSGREILKEFLETDELSFASRNSIFNYANFISDDNPEEALILYSKLINLLKQSNNDLSDNELNQLYTSVYTYKALIHRSLDNNSDCISNIYEALKYCTISEQLYLQFLLYTSSTEDIKEDTQEIIASTIIENQLKLTETDNHPCDFNYNHLLIYLDLVFNERKSKNYDSLMNYAVEKLNIDKSKAQITLDMEKILDSENNHLSYFLNNNKDTNIDNLELLNVLRSISLKYCNRLDIFYSYFNRYKKLFDSIDEITQVDIYLFIIAVKNLHGNNKNKDALDLCFYIEERFNNINHDMIDFDFIFIYYWASLISLYEKDFLLSLKYANQTLGLIDNFEIQPTSLIDEEALKSIREQMTEIKRLAKADSNSKNSHSVPMKKYSRNQRVKVYYPNQGFTGVTRIEKFKHVIDDIENRKCIIID